MKLFVIAAFGVAGFAAYKLLKSDTPERTGTANDEVVEFEGMDIVGSPVPVTVREISEDVRRLQTAIDAMCMGLEQAAADSASVWVNNAGVVPPGGALTPSAVERMQWNLPASAGQLFPILTDSGVCGKVTEAYWRILYSVMLRTVSYVSASGDSRLVEVARLRGFEWVQTDNLLQRTEQVNAFLDFCDRYPALLGSTRLACIWLMVGDSVQDQMADIRRLWEYVS